MSDAIEAAENLVAGRGLAEFCGPIHDDAKAHSEPVHSCEIDVLPRVAHCIGKGLKLMLFKHGRLLGLDRLVRGTKTPRSEARLAVQRTWRHRARALRAVRRRRIVVDGWLIRRRDLRCSCSQKVDTHWP